jgi:hypothetical protein
VPPSPRSCACSRSATARPARPGPPGRPPPRRPRASSRRLAEERFGGDLSVGAPARQPEAHRGGRHHR